MDAVCVNGEGEVNVIVHEEEGAGSAAPRLELTRDGELEALLSGLIPELDQAGAALDGLLRNL
jgi:hypothetical protein